MSSNAMLSSGLRWTSSKDAAMAQASTRRKIMSQPDPQRLREYRKRADLKRCRNQVQARLPPELADRFRQYMRTKGLNKNQALLSIVSAFLNQC